jgi:hypothetical protein
MTTRAVPPLTVALEWSQGHYWIVHDATGRTVAQGSREMCERRAAGWDGLAEGQGDLFE